MSRSPELDHPTRLWAMSCHLSALPRLVAYVVVYGFAVIFLWDIFLPSSNGATSYLQLNIGFGWILLGVILFFTEPLGLISATFFCRYIVPSNHEFVEAQARSSLKFQRRMVKYFAIAYGVFTLLIFGACVVDQVPNFTILQVSTITALTGLITLGIVQARAMILAARQAYRGYSFQYPWVEN
jgi:uncharacterized Tic20 family protein